MVPWQVSDQDLHWTPSRISVGEPGARSTVWRVWANRNKSDVYLASRRSAGIFKVSLHESGDWRLQWVSDDRKGLVHVQQVADESVNGRIIHRWRRPPASSTGWTDALSIWVPNQDLMQLPRDDEPAEDSQWLASPQVGEVVEFRVFLVRPRLGPFDLTPALQGGKASGSFINGFRLANGEVLLIFSATGPLDGRRARDLEKYRRRAWRQVESSFDLSPDRGPRAMVWEVEPDGHRSIWDLALS